MNKVISKFRPLMFGHQDSGFKEENKLQLKHLSDDNFGTDMIELQLIDIVSTSLSHICEKIVVA